MNTSFFSGSTARHLIAGRWISGGPTRESVNPATDEVLGTYFDGDLTVARSAIDAAAHAFAEGCWRSDRELRSRVLWDLADAVEDHFDRLATAITLENGKTLLQAKFELSIAAPKLRYYAGLALTDLGTAAVTKSGGVSMLLKEPIGVAGIIVPWNSPVILAIRSLAPALAAGCTTAIKMPAQTALTGTLLAEVLNGVTSLPPGVINVFTESGSEGAQELISSTKVGVISYTGSTAVGAKIMAAAAPQLKRVSLELGGKSPMIVFDDADLDAVIPVLTAAATTFSGQFCMTGSRMLVQQAVAEEVRQRLTQCLKDIRIGPGMEPSTQMGPLIDHGAVDRIDSIITNSQDADIILRGGRIDGPGSFYRPAILGVQDLNSPLIQQELFGPVVTFEVFDTEDEAIKRSNATKYGLSASLWTNDGARSLRISAALEAGTVWTNDWAQIFDQFEEGGYKSSGIGRLNGPGGLAEFQEVKHIYRAF